MKKFFKWIGIIFVGLIALGIIIDMTTSPEEKAAQEAAKQVARAQKAAEEKTKQYAESERKKAEIDALPSVTSIQMAKDYSANTVAADKKYKGKQFKVTGKITSINTDILGNPYLTLRGTNEFMEPQYSFKKKFIDQLAEMQVGITVTMICTGKGDIAKIPMSDECQVF